MRVMNTTLMLVFLMAGCSEPDADISAVDLFTDYQKPATADSHYKDKILAVSGIVKSGGDAIDLPYGAWNVYLSNGKDKDIAVVCRFSPKSAAQAKRLGIGQSVVIRGVCKGTTWGGGVPFLFDCDVVE